MSATRPVKPRRSRVNHAYTLAEVVISVAVAAVSIGGIVWGYVMAGRRLEWATCSAAAHLLAVRQMETTRAAKWDPHGYPAVDELDPTNFPPDSPPLDVPLAGTNQIMATLDTRITVVSTDPPLKMIRVDCSWSLMGRGPFTNTVITYRAPDQ